jgi:hypothetical protein
MRVDLKPALTQNTEVSNPSNQARTYYSTISVSLLRVVPLAIALYALSNIPVANGGPLEYGACMVTCMSSSPHTYSICEMTGSVFFSRATITTLAECTQACAHFLLNP